MISSTPILKVENLEITFQEKDKSLSAVKDISYEIYKGEVLGIVGESGCGKSITSLAIMGLLSHPGFISGGSVYFDQKNITHMEDSSRNKIRGNKMAMIFQEPMTALNPVLTIGSQIVEQIITHTDLNKKEALEKSIELLDRVGIPSASKRIGQYPYELSGGMRQRVMIAMALSCEPVLLIADEPTTALDVTIQAQILDLLRSLQEEYNMAIQFITHDLGVVSEICDRVLVMYAGTIVEESSSKEFFKNPLHPYSKGLLNSIPSNINIDGTLNSIPGQVPSLEDMPSGCRFQNRCSMFKDKCGFQQPSIKLYGCNSQKASCHYI